MSSTETRPMIRARFDYIGGVQNDTAKSGQIFAGTSEFAKRARTKREALDGD